MLSYEITLNLLVYLAPREPHTYERRDKQLEGRLLNINPLIDVAP